MIYLVEDESSIRNLVVYTLNNAGLAAEGFADGQQFFVAIQQQLPSLVLLDIMLPGEDGLSILQKLRATPATAALPIMLLTAKDTEYDKVLGLDLGADDYLPKPFGMMELVARVKSLLRRAQQQSGADEYQLGELFLSVSRHLVKVAGKPITLTLKEFDVLLLLLKNQGLVLSREQIMANVWGYDFDGESRTVDVHIRSLRVKLGPAGELIETVRGVGYRMGGVA